MGLYDLQRPPTIVPIPSSLCLSGSRFFALGSIALDVCLHAYGFFCSLSSSLINTLTTAHDYNVHATKPVQDALLPPYTALALAGNASTILDPYNKLSPRNAASQAATRRGESLLMFRNLERMETLLQVKVCGRVVMPLLFCITNVVVVPCMHLALCIVCMPLKVDEGR